MDSCLRKVTKIGVNLNNIFYWHDELTKFRGENVVVNYDVNNFSTVEVQLSNGRTISADSIKHKWRKISMSISMDITPDDQPKNGNPLEERKPKLEETVCEFCVENGSDVCKCYGEYNQ